MSIIEMLLVNISSRLRCLGVACVSVGIFASAFLLMFGYVFLILRLVHLAVHAGSVYCLETLICDTSHYMSCGMLNLFTY